MRAITATCGCGECKGGIRNCPLTENELNELERARNVDPKRLSAMLPRWLKAHLAECAPIKRTEVKPWAGQKPVLPRAGMTNINAPQVYVIPESLPEGEPVLPAYIAEFLKLNYLTH